MKILLDIYPKVKYNYNIKENEMRTETIEQTIREAEALLLATIVRLAETTQLELTTAEEAGKALVAPKL